jgi:hypothetical protein
VIDPEELCLDFRYMNPWVCPQDDTELAFLLTGGDATTEYCNFLFVGKLGPDYDLDTCFTFCTEYVGQEPLSDEFFDDNFLSFNEGNCCAVDRVDPNPISDYQ